MGISNINFIRTGAHKHLIQRQLWSGLGGFDGVVEETGFILHPEPLQVLLPEGVTDLEFLL